MKTLLRYIKIYPHFVAMCIKSKLAYKVDTIIGIFSFLFINIISFSTIYLTISSIPSLNGWTIANVAFLYGFGLIPKSIDHIFTDNLWMLAGEGVKRGIIDRYLVKPMNPLFLLIADDFQYDGFGELILGIILICSFGGSQNISWNFSNISALVICCFVSIFLFTAIKLIYASIAFWTKRSIEILNSVYYLSEYTKYPIDIFNKAIKVILVYIIPFSLVMYYPIVYLIDGKNIWLLTLIIVGVVTLFSSLGYFLWHQGLKRYESAGS